MDCWWIQVWTEDLLKKNQIGEQNHCIICTNTKIDFSGIMAPTCSPSSFFQIWWIFMKFLQSSFCTFCVLNMYLQYHANFQPIRSSLYPLKSHGESTRSVYVRRYIHAIIYVKFTSWWAEPTSFGYLSDIACNNTTW